MLLLRALFFEHRELIAPPVSGLLQKIIACYETWHPGILIFPRYMTNDDKMFSPDCTIQQSNAIYYKARIRIKQE